MTHSDLLPAQDVHAHWVTRLDRRRRTVEQGPVQARGWPAPETLTRANRALIDS